MRAGDRWVILAGGQAVFHFSIEKFAIGEGCFPAAIGIGRVVSEEQPDFSRVSPKYYVAMPERDYVAAAAAKISTGESLWIWTILSLGLVLCVQWRSENESCT
jgi:hypothetical protein